MKQNDYIKIDGGNTTVVLPLVLTDHIFQIFETFDLPMLKQNNIT